MNAAYAICVGALASLISVHVLCAEPAKAPVQPLGEFAQVRTTEDHAYGHAVRLWRSDSQLLGQILYWDASPEAQRGSFADGTYNRTTGTVRFNVVIVRRDVQPNERTEASFEGVLAKGRLSGKLKWAGEIAKFRGKNGVEDLMLPLQKSERLVSFASVEAWRRAVAE
jgi:hypothetical protein